MPNDTLQAVEWALQQTFDIDGEIYNITKNTPSYLVDKVREYFNDNNIQYNTFSYKDLLPYL